MKGRITEVFDSVQGEGIYVGERQLFVRFFGCNLACKFCDTKSERFTEYQPQELFAELKLYADDYHSVSFTGGEPLLQKDFLKEILQLTHKGGFKNYLETNGTLAAELGEVIDYLDIVAMDIKLPSSTGSFPYWRAHQEFLKTASLKEVFVKMVICHSTRVEDIINALGLVKEVNPAATIILQPDSAGEPLALDRKIEYFKMLSEDHSLVSCAIPQMHKIIGVP
ncbi:MAG: 7-carboxy-7-deazaguanine synthase QueE [Candidatus Omnitrophica bacterium]|nr:7-carboxy-7-deazaguanine synthase QueE [Candidatus Omnitrophota bacterium]